MGGNGKEELVWRRAGPSCLLPPTCCSTMVSEVQSPVLHRFHGSLGCYPGKGGTKNEGNSRRRSLMLAKDPLRELTTEERQAVERLARSATTRPAWSSGHRSLSDSPAGNAPGPSAVRRPGLWRPGWGGAHRRWP